MKLAALFSGGKDSTYAIFKSKLEGHNIKCLVTIFPKSIDSYLFHFPNIHLTTIQAKSIGIPQILTSVDSDNVESEVSELEKALIKAKKEFEIDGIVHGGILSEFQKKKFEMVCAKLNLKINSPLWNSDQKKYLQTLVDSEFQFIIISVSSAGLDESWLGVKITDKEVEQLAKLSKKHGFNLNFEGGEAETLVLNCPLFSSPIKILKSNKIWDGYRGRLEITEVALVK